MAERFINDLIGQHMNHSLGGFLTYSSRDKGDFYEVAVELPGFDSTDVDITFKYKHLTIMAKRSVEGEIPRAFSRKFLLKDPVKIDSIKAKLDKGVLIVTIDKAEEAKPVKVNIVTE